MAQDKDRVFDKRVVRRNIQAGRLSQQEYQGFLASLPDSAVKIRARDDGGDDDGYDRPVAGSPPAGLERAPASPATPPAPPTMMPPQAYVPDVSVAAAPVSPVAPEVQPPVAPEVQPGDAVAPANEPALAGDSEPPRGPGDESV